MNIVDYAETVFYPLTHPQKRIWYQEKIYPHTSLYNIGGPIRVKGDVNFDVLKECINHFIKKNDALRLRIIEDELDVKQYVSEYNKIDLDFIDFSGHVNPEDEFNKWIDTEAKKPIVLENNWLFYFALFKISDNDMGYLAKFHHIICDGWSINIMTDEISSNYMSLISGEELDDRIKCSYLEYIDNEKKYLSSYRFLKNKNFWMGKYNDFPESLLNDKSESIEGHRKTFDLDVELGLKIKNFVADRKYSLNTFFVTLYLLYIHKKTQHEDIIIGTPVLNRSGKKEKSIVGMFTSTMPFRFKIDEDISVADMMFRVNEELQRCYFNQKYPYNLLIQDLEMKKNGYDNLFNFCLNYYNTQLASEMNGYPVENKEFYNGNQIYALQMVVKDWSSAGSLTLDFDYKITNYSANDIECMYSHLLTLINQIVERPLYCIRDLSLLSNSERTKLLFEFNDTKTVYPKDKLIYELFEEQVLKTPHKIAVSYNNSELTYKVLNEKANQLARFIVEKGVEEETIVGLLTSHSIESVISMLAIIKAGGAYLPIDPSYPSDRVNYMLEDSNCKMLLTNIELSEMIRFSGEIIDVSNVELYVGDTRNLDVINKPGDLVYVMYTSGSTGKPKGTMIEHQGLVNYTWWSKKMYVKSDDEVFPLYSSLAFDLTVTSVFTPLISGSRIIVYDDQRDDEEYVLYRIMKDNKATIIKLTPSHLSLLKDMNNKGSSVRRFIVGGEDLKTSLASEIYASFEGEIELYNEYGPTETVVGCMIHKFDCENDTRVSVPIGVPADNVQIYILDKNLQVIPSKMVGEMYISGDGVARGYMNRPELTQEKFVLNDSVFNGKRLYKTGDLARFLENGLIEYVGRADQQTKIRGYRIELGEVEEYLLRHESVKDAIVVDLEDSGAKKYLSAYYVRKFEALEVKDDELKEFLLSFLPSYMIPVHFVELDHIPLTRNGKVNRALLPKPDDLNVGHADFIEYSNEKERILVNAICAVLNMESVSLNHNFYHLGGDSIKAIQMASKIKEQGFKIKVKDILSNPIILEMASYIEQRNGVTISQEPCEGEIKQTPILSWFFAQRFTNPNYYNQSIFLEAQQTVEVEALEIVFNELIRHHDSLRICYSLQTGRLYYNNQHLDRRYTISVHDLTECSNIERTNRMTELANNLKSSFNIEEDILIKACILELGPNEKRLLITAHHVVVDGVSWRIIIEDLNTMLMQLNRGEVIKLPLKTHSYQEWANVLESHCENENIESERNYWEQILAKEFRFPTDNESEEDTVSSRITLTEEIGENDTERLITKAGNSYQTEAKDLLIASLLRIIKKYSGSNEIVIELEGHGRNEMFENIDISRTVGWFTCLYPFYIKLEEDDLPSQIKAIKERIRDIPNKGIGYGILAIGSTGFSSNSNKNNNTRKYIRFNFLGEFTVRKNNFLNILDEQMEGDYDQRNQLTSVMEINAFIMNGRLKVNLSYSTSVLSSGRMENFLKDYMTDLIALINHCCEKESVEFTPSDFDAADISQQELDSLFN